MDTYDLTSQTEEGGICRLGEDVEEEMLLGNCIFACS